MIFWLTNLIQKFCLGATQQLSFLAYNVILKKYIM